MWLITHTTSGESVCLLTEKLKYSVGRVGADVELNDDICVSRAHAAFHLVKNDEQYKLELEDLGSKYGTFLNQNIDTNTMVEKGTKIPLKNNDLIRFGRLQNIWKVQFMNIRTATSSLPQEDMVQLKTYISSLGGKILDHWSQYVTHLTMKDPAVTVKLLHALVEQRPVVTPNYWKDLLSTVGTSGKVHLPKPESYKLNFGDGDIDASCNIKRRLVFRGHIFVFLNRKHFDTYGPLVKAAGGLCKDLNSGVQKTFLIKDKVVVVQYTPSTQTQSSQTINSIADFLESNSKRIIPEYEIGLAVLHCSVEKFCNPSFKMTQTMPLTVPNELTDDSLQIEENKSTSLNSESMELVISETNDNLVTSTPYVNAENTKASTSYEKHSMENPRKRKMMSVDRNESDESDEGDLFQFQSKKTCQKDVANNKEESPNKTINVFLQKSQHKNKSEVSVEQTAEQHSTNKEKRKRPLIQVLNEDDDANDDDLFSFGDTQKTKRARQQNVDEETDDLFSFKEKEDAATKKSTRTIELDEDSNDMEPTQQFVVVTKKPAIQMPKPKILPRKISAIEWISTSLGKINIKKENSAVINDENDNGNQDENVIKTESEIKTEIGGEISITEDHRKWLESLKGAVEIQQVSLKNTMKSVDKSHYKFKNRSNNTGENLNESMPNFKRFVKKYRVPAQNNSVSIKLHLR